MRSKILLLPVLLFLGYGLVASNDFATIASGVAIFIVGMLFMEDGFRLFTGGVLEKILQKTTDTVIKSIFSGFFATALIQSSSLTSVIAISFLSAELIGLSQAIGIIFGANIGTTATAWIVSAFGMKIKISVYAMPMLVFGVIFLFFKARSYKGLGNILLGLGFIFLGIAFMKDGFETLKQNIDLASFAMDGLIGVIGYVLIGAAATVIIQSSSATMALIITAVATGQIDYMNSLSLAIGANIGTTVTAALGALTSNANGKRLAVAHFIFNSITAIFAIVFLRQLQGVVEIISGFVGLKEDDIAMKLALFHTIFNLAGVLLVSPFIGVLVRFLKGLFIGKGDRRGKPKYLDEEVMKSPGPALVSLYKETEHLYDSISYVLAGALHVSPQKLAYDENDENDEKKDAVTRVEEEDIDVDQIYDERIKFLYSDILRYAVLAEQSMVKDERKKSYNIKIVCRDLIETVKDIREIQKNITYYMGSDNKWMKEEYNILRENIAEVLRVIAQARTEKKDGSGDVNLKKLKGKYKKLDTVTAKRLSRLLRDNRIDETMASSLMNDGTYARKITKHLLKSARSLWGDHYLLDRTEVHNELDDEFDNELDQAA